MLTTSSTPSETYGHLPAMNGNATLTVGQRIKAAREAKGWSQPQLGDAVGVTGATIYRYESAKPTAIKPSIERLIAIAAALDVPVSELVPDNYIPSPSDAEASPVAEATPEDYLRFIELASAAARGSLEAKLELDAWAKARVRRLRTADK